MLFNSYVFIFAFLPITFTGFYLIGRYSHALASLWLASASLFFYGWWNIEYIALLLTSITFNYGAGYLIGHKVTRKPSIRPIKLLSGAITVNLLLLGYFKYANFFVENMDLVTGLSFSIQTIILPLGISFFTFTQIAFLVDTYQGKVKEYNFVHYTTFVTYFPHLIAGPILHHTEMMPQLAQRNVCRINWTNVAVGLTIFIFGLAKKILIADTLAGVSGPIFHAVSVYGHPMFFEAWIGALAYTFQLYFDFSAYSDMAIGLSLMFNVKLPINFNSPYKSTSIIEFWRRWHMTLSRFLRDYLYIPLGGNRKGKTRRYLNLMITMLLGGLWHGAGWTFVIWGGLHGCYLVVNHAWRKLQLQLDWKQNGRFATTSSGFLTFIAVVAAWVFFRAENAGVAIDILKGMAGLNGISFSKGLDNSALANILKNHGIHFVGLFPLSLLRSGNANIVYIAALIAFFFPSLLQIFSSLKPSLGASELQNSASNGNLMRWCSWKFKPSYAVLASLLLIYEVLSFTKTSEFLYFQF